MSDHKNMTLLCFNVILDLLNIHIKIWNSGGGGRQKAEVVRCVNCDVLVFLFSCSYSCFRQFVC